MNPGHSKINDKIKKEAIRQTIGGETFLFYSVSYGEDSSLECVYPLLDYSAGYLTRCWYQSKPSMFLHITLLLALLLGK